jgi:siroheme synthase (precorrin-2 oxidase/ferrochelatase)
MSYCINRAVSISPDPFAPFFRRIDELLDPELVEAANMLAEWREKYQNEITVRTKKRWWRRMFKVSGKEERRNRKRRS